MRYTMALLVGACWSSVLSSTLSGQPILDRVERLLRGPAGAGAQVGAPAEPGYLGLVGDDRQEVGRGVRVLNVVAAGPAAVAGFRAGDLIIQVNGQAVRSMDDMATALAGKPEGTRLSMTVERAGANQQLNVTLGRRASAAPANRSVEQLPQPEAPPPRLGVRTLDVSEDARQQNNLPDNKGAMIIAVVPGSAADRAGLPLGAVIKAVDNQPVNSPQELAEAVRTKPGNALELTYVYGGVETRKRVALGAEPAATVVAKPPSTRAPAPTPAPPTPSPPASDEGPALAGLPDARVAALEGRIRELEARIAALESKMPEAKKEPPADKAP
jgi:S1-C subfamily serine protease